MNGIDLRKVFSPGDKVVNPSTYEVHIVLDVNAKNIIIQSITTGHKKWSDSTGYVPLPSLLTHLKQKVSQLKAMRNYTTTQQVIEYHQATLSHLRSISPSTYQVNKQTRKEIMHHERILKNATRG